MPSSRLAFSRDALMRSLGLLTRYSNSRAVVRELLRYFVGPARHIATDCGSNHHAVADFGLCEGIGRPATLADCACDPSRDSSTERPTAPLMQRLATLATTHRFGRRAMTERLLKQNGLQPWSVHPTNPKDKPCLR